MSAQKKFKTSFPDLGESTVCHVKYLEAVKQGIAQGDSSPVISIPLKRMGRPLTLGDLNSKVQQYTHVHNVHQSVASGWGTSWNVSDQLIEQ